MVLYCRYSIKEASQFLGKLAEYLLAKRKGVERKSRGPAIDYFDSNCKYLKNPAGIKPKSTWNLAAAYLNSDNELYSFPKNSLLIPKQNQFGLDTLDPEDICL